MARAKAAGADGVTIVLSLVGAERAADLIAFAKKLGECSGQQKGKVSPLEPSAPWTLTRGHVRMNVMLDRCALFPRLSHASW